MKADARQELADLLGDLRSGGSFCSHRTAAVDDLVIEVRGVGPLRLPVSAAQAKELRLVARPARYGKGEQTIVDRRVRDTWEVPRSRVKIDKRRWNTTLGPMLDTVREDLGLPANSSLRAELHSMLVYEPQQFFAPHQDSEKNDQMIGSLVVLLPSRTKGGELVVEHRGESVRHRGSTSSLTFVAFYADTRHEVLPLQSGYRVALTYNLMLTGDTSPENRDTTSLATTAAELLDQHFSHPPEPRWRGDRQASEPPDRLVFLLDHQYTKRGLRWSQLKGDDTIRADVLHHASQVADCEVALAHAEIQETWECYDDETPYWERRHWSDWDTDPAEADLANGDLAEADHELGELLDSTVGITPAAGEVMGLDPNVTSAELAASTPSVELTPYDTEYTGYMGNWGNTMDRWYRRAAIVIWPRSRSFAVRAKGDPVGALHELLASTADDPDAVLTRADNVSTLLRFWSDNVNRQDQRTLLPPALLLARELRDETLATRLLEPFELEAIAASNATVVLALTEQHGRRWFDQQLTAWMNKGRRFSPRAPTDREAWIETLPDICTQLLDDQHAPTDLKAYVARSIMGQTWSWLSSSIAHGANTATPSLRLTTLHELAAPLLAVMRCTDITDDPELRKAIIDTVCDPALKSTPMLLEVLDASTALPPGQLDAIGVTALARHCASTLQDELDLPERSDDDWSITEFEPGDCCDDCVHLAGFLSDATQQQLTWPLAKPRRQHIHRRIDEAELPVTHRTKREGSPHKLVLTKTSELFSRDAERRTKARTSLDSVQQLLDR